MVDPLLTEQQLQMVTRIISMLNERDGGIGGGKSRGKLYNAQKGVYVMNHIEEKTLITYPNSTGITYRFFKST